ncbi:hypothetical protein B9Q06_09990 [Candidatus Marsarchaeota G2 archaeon ECH_B_2]|uniref:DNA methylase N-4/N-6 domain-containing protein n=3 Tax=Candidatus Marsarchaeota group 2 TaxID=2203771 RepID=A0A2R6B6D9_9ARCH|nr:MAG: hypothetical protein B9Q06_09990 [Candidatus Marsarchaeota G2 archaeon ECH_B_2]PSN98729.1 MAG: hypothetical protein B9Q07_08875 [Candidatus Marsarchaeota G2 archaeon ECH_B_3]PSO00672.1 MAG: hypothetical protein B9Q05_10185 [Candidatus Marsarchaeota G2 archaeon ECH_B_1]
MLGSGKIQTRLEWEGKRTEVEKIKLPFQIVETVNEPRTKTMDTFVLGTDKWYNMLIWGDNKLVMSSLLPEYAGKNDLIYIDPPFATCADFTTPIKIEDEEIVKEASGIEIRAYRDTWGQGLTSYLQMIYDRLVLMRELLSERGSIYVHMDSHVGHYVKVLMDEIFGKENFQREIIWRIGWVSGYKTATENWIRNHDTILYYTKSNDYIFNKLYIPHPPNYVRRGSDKPTGKGIPIEDVWGLFQEEGLTSIQIMSFSREKLGLPDPKT